MSMLTYFGMEHMEKIADFTERTKKEKLKNALPSNAKLSDALIIKNRIAGLLKSGPLFKAPLGRCASNTYTLSICVLNVMIEEGYVQETCQRHGSTLMSLTEKGLAYCKEKKILPILHPPTRSSDKRLQDKNE